MPREKQEKPEPLRELRRRVRALIEERDVAGAIGFAESIETDPRAGARDLARGCRRWAEQFAAERVRVESLFELRRGLFESGHRLVAGVDEVGVGPLAGPVVAGAVILPELVDLPGVNDSKKLTSRSRERLDVAIREQAVAIGIGEVSPLEIDRMNIFQASLEAMRRAVSALDPEPDFLLVDARTVPRVAIRQKALIHGDAIDGSIAAASIVAKVYRDRLMNELDECHPGYGFSRHMGYGTALHMDALERLGACPQHRRSFSPVAAAIRAKAPIASRFPDSRP
jgi:ribonuclease HII